ncbi:Methyltransferase-like protein 20 -like protein [Toxocara canis]|uniref:ETFB lysine methyltransferase n=1 Tax=Toxocara canis TaxID=6265 RepID=A0A0B2VRR4_TOXCA|nr:Methyltransferase-like protein 20 -like protein [Toxocara canis]
MVSLSTRQVVKWILRNTCKSKESLTPEITLRLITERCPMWMATPDQCPLPDPYWAFYWPGGQALTRFVLDHGQLFRGHRVLDFGSGCGATSIAAIWSGADHVFVNDIDTSAILASRLNFKLNKTVHSKVTFSNLNLLQPYNEPVWEAFISRQKTYVLLGDMFYDTDFAMIVFKWLQKVQSQGNVSILVGDPGRHPLADEKYRSQVGVKFEKHILHEYAALPYITKEHYGLTSLKVFHIHFL